MTERGLIFKRSYDTVKEYLTDHKPDFIKALPVMSIDETIALNGFIRWMRAHGKDDADILPDVLHDVAGIYNRERAFSPRSSSYAKFAE